MKKAPAVLIAILLMVTAFAVPSAAQEQDKPKQDTPAQQVPDAPSASRPAQQEPFPAGTAPAPAIPGREVPEDGQQQDAEMPPSTVTPVPRGQGAREDDQDLFKIVADVNFVFVPVTVRDTSGRLVEGLLEKDFRVIEDGVEQKITYFTSDPFALAAAVVVDQGLPSTAMRKVNDTLPSLVAAFSDFDSVSLFTYGNTVSKALPFGAAGDRLSNALTRVKRPGRTGGVPVTGGPMASGPTVNNRPFDPGQPSTRGRITQPESRVLNDALLRAALELAEQPRTRRKIIFLISDGTELGSSAGTNEVLKVLLSNEITVYAVGVSSAAIPGYSDLERIRIPGSRYHGNLLPRYANATGGELFAEFTASAIERAYMRATEVARNQYTLGYTTRATQASNYRPIDVRVRRPNLTVLAKEGYYPLPPRRGAEPQ